MSLLTTLSYALVSGTPVTYTLKAEATGHLFNRLATQAPLPSVSGNTPGDIFVLDLGMLIEQISLVGLVDTIVTSGVPLFPSKNDLEDICRNWWVYTNVGAETSTLPQLTIDSGQTYAVTIKQADFKREAALEDRWSYAIIFLIQQKIYGV